MQKIIKNCISFILSAAVGVSFFCTETTAIAADDSDSGLISASTSEESVGEYSVYLDNYMNIGYAQNDYEASFSMTNTWGDAALSFSQDTIEWNGTGKVIFIADIQQSGLYNIKINWRPLESGINITLGVEINGSYPFSEMRQIELVREWKNAEDKPRTDSLGNEYAPEQCETGEFIQSYVRDPEGIVSKPYLIYLEKGTNSIALSESNQKIEISDVILSAPEIINDYESVSAEYNFEKSEASEIINLQGESADVKTSNSNIPKSNTSNAGMNPADPYKTKINYIGGTSWQTTGDTLKWNFHVKKEGYYYINMRYKQSDLINGESWRALKIDGKTPFTEADEMRFAYSTGWEYYIFGDSSDRPYYIWLDEGDHTISLEVTIGDQADFFIRLSELIDILADEYIKIVMITGESPDANRDYELFNQIPNFTETLTDTKEKLDSLADDMKDSAGSRSTQCIAAIENMSRVLGSMLRSPYVAQQYVTDYYNNYTTLSSWLYDMKQMPLSLDEINIVPYGMDVEERNVGFFESLSFGAIRLIASFSSEYQIYGNQVNDNNKTIRLWVNWGQDQAAVLNSLIGDSFTPETGINVKLEIVSASLVNGILSGNFPDIALQMSRTEPVNLGMRGALYDLTNFPDYEQVLERFMPGAETPYMYNDALYALPDTQSFFIMFYRNDILSQLGLEVPETWEDFHYAATVIQRNNMNVYVPYTQITSATTVNVGLGSLNLFPTLMSQRGLSFYNSAKTATSLTSQEVIDVFEYWTDFYNNYGFLKEADFYNRFRVGVMPLGIAPYTTYMTLYSAAPEIKDRWSIAMVPGFEKENRTVAGAGTGCAIIAKSSNKEEAWEFLKWWTSAEIQQRYSSNVESLLGMIGRITTSTVEALKSLTWEPEALEVITEQWEMVRELPEIPGSYYLTRAVDQAFWSVVNKQSTPKDALEKWSQVADDEIERKIKEYT